LNTRVKISEGGRAYVETADLVKSALANTQQTLPTLAGPVGEDDSKAREAICEYRAWQDNDDAVPDHNMLEIIVLALETKLGIEPQREDEQ
jgi:hypothetical protein